MTTPTHPNTASLFTLMEQNGLKRHDVAELLGCDPHTVSCWRGGSRHIPDRQLELLTLKLELRRLQKKLAYFEAHIPFEEGCAHA